MKLGLRFIHFCIIMINNNNNILNYKIELKSVHTPPHSYRKQHSSLLSPFENILINHFTFYQFNFCKHEEIKMIQILSLY